MELYNTPKTKIETITKSIDLPEPETETDAEAEAIRPWSIFGGPLGKNLQKNLLKSKETN